MGAFPVVLLLCGIHALTAGAQTPTTTIERIEAPAVPSNCREEMYPCTRMYSVHQPTKRCIGGFCLYSLSRMYVINNEICTRIVCSEDEYMKAELCRERSGWPRRIERATNRGRRLRCRGRGGVGGGKPNTWAVKF
ncbi:microfibril associated protein 5 [Eucyclogobius newberryi]|uniref:microfibril associated protein 5 n=1 Tax=Eucyclogobius newberryi TaxID=166745 RepID=UPI003B5BB1DD